MPRTIGAYPYGSKCPKEKKGTRENLPHTFTPSLLPPNTGDGIPLIVGILLLHLMIYLGGHPLAGHKKLPHNFTQLHAISSRGQTTVDLPSPLHLRGLQTFALPNKATVSDPAPSEQGYT